MSIADQDFRLVEENEQALLGAILHESSYIGDVNDLLSREDFYFEKNALIYSAALYMYMSGRPVDIITVTNFLRDKGKLERCGGASYVSSLCDMMPDVGSTLSYAEAVKNFSLNRGLEKLANDIKNSLEISGPAEVIDYGMTQLIKLSESSTDSNQVPISNVVDKTVERLIAVHEGEKEQQKYVLTGYNQLDRITTGLRPKDMFILAARPSVGKTAFATNIAVNVAKSNNPVLFFSLEMDKERLINRILAAETGIPYRTLDSEMLNSEQVQRLRAARDIFTRIPLFIDDSSKQTLAGIRTKSRRQMAKTGLSLVIVDYIQYACNNPEDREEIAMWSAGLKSIAKDVDVTMMPLAQLNRFVEHRDSPRPQMSDLKGSSQPEQDADILMFLYNHDPRNQLSKTGAIMKHRNGPLGDIQFDFNNRTCLFTEKGVEIDEG